MTRFTETLAVTDSCDVCDAHPRRVRSPPGPKRIATKPASVFLLAAHLIGSPHSHNQINRSGKLIFKSQKNNYFRDQDGFKMFGYFCFCGCCLESEPALTHTSTTPPKLHCLSSFDPCALYPQSLGIQSCGT